MVLAVETGEGLYSVVALLQQTVDLDLRDLTGASG